jgi:hypothetical protein
MATLFKNKLQTAIGTTESTVLTTESNAKTTVIGLSLTNLTEFVVITDIKLEDTIAGTSAYYVKGAVIPPNQSLRVINGGERLVLGNTTRVKIKSNIDASLDLVMSYVEIV